MDKMTRNQFVVSVLLVVLAAMFAFPSALAKGKPACNDRVDNDGDGYVDLNDPGCTETGDRSELNPYVECDDSFDNDGDGKADYRDAGCSGPLDDDESNCGDLVCEGAETQASCPNDCGYSDTCSDTDGGNNINAAGAIFGYYNGGEYYNADSCADSSNVVEYYCDGNYGAGQQQICQYGCSGGKCNSAPAPTDSCNDTDGGVVTTVKGTVYGYYGGVSYNRTDYCTSPYYIAENYCSGSQAMVGNYLCGSLNNGSYPLCANGVCVPNSQVNATG